MDHHPSPRTAIPFFVLSFFLVYIFASGVQHELSRDSPSTVFTKGSGFPDFGNYRRVATVSAKQLSLDDPERRAIIVGDVHGMKLALDGLLKQVSYNEEKDTLIHLGDITTKAPLTGSLSVLSFMNENNITGVRGNHDQKVIEWRAWLNWVDRLEAGAGSRWLSDLEKKWEEGNVRGKLEESSDTEEWVATQMRMGRKDHKWWSRVPKGWKLFSDHYRIARLMSESDYHYLLSLPLVLHVPSEHAFLVHAGLLPYDPRLSITSKRQPLAHLPKLRSAGLGSSVPALRNAQELAILDDIKQNNNPWVVLNIRNLRKDNTVSRKTNKGKAWADVWNETVSQCAGFERGAQKEGNSLPCHPFTVVYGHAASRGLDVHRWAVGLDTGCVYGRKLTALVLGATTSHRSTVFRNAYGSDGPRDDDDYGDGNSIESIPQVVPFGDNRQARLVSVRCHKPKV